MSRLLGRGVSLGLLAVAMLGGPSAAQALSWSAPIAVDLGGRQLTSVSCPNSTLCATVDVVGYESTFAPDPASPGATTTLIDTGDPNSVADCPSDGPGNCALKTVSCVSAHVCVAVDTNTLEMTFDPGAPTAKNHGDIDSGGPSFQPSAKAMACPATSQCTVLDNTGSYVTFSPSKPKERPGYQFDPNGQMQPLTGIACPSVKQCTAVDSGGGELTFNPQVKSQPKRVEVDKHGWLNAVSCPSTNQCTAVDRQGNEVTFNPHSGHSKRVGVDSAGINGIACPTSNECVGADRNGHVVSGAPGRKWKTQTLSATARLEAVTCISKSECVVVDSAGEAFVSS